MASRPPRPTRPTKTTKAVAKKAAPTKAVAKKAAPTKAASTKAVEDLTDTDDIDVAEETTSEISDEATAVVKRGSTAQLPHHSFLTRLYTGTGAFEVVGRRKLWYGISGAIVAIAILSILIRGFTFGIDFKGGTTVSFPRGDAQVAQVQEVFNKTVGKDPESVVIVANGAAAAVQIRSETLTNDQTAKLRTALFDAFQPKGPDGKPSKAAISDSAVSETWGDQITNKALIALGVFLLLVGIYIMVRYERYMAISALITMVFDLTVTAGVYSLVGFEVTPATVIGLLTILGFSLYDTVIVFDKVEENTRGFQHTTRRSFAEQANLAINQTFMRSINTSLIGVLPVLALMVVAVWLLGVGTLKDLALVQLVGILVGTYSSIFFATPLLVTLRERTDLVRSHTRRVDRRRSPDARGADAANAEASTTEAAKTAEKPTAKATKTADEPTEAAGDDATKEITQAATTEAAPTSDAPTQEAPSKPGPGARPVRPTGTRRPTGKRNAGRR
jgi:preprotein translocase subunit SecF